CGRLGFDARADRPPNDADGFGAGDDSNGSNAFDSMPGSGPDGMPAMFVGTLGSTTCGAGTMSITIGAAGVPVGHRIVAILVQRIPQPGVVSVADTRGNAYAVGREEFPGGVPDLRLDIVSAPITQSLASGDAVTV